MRVVSDENLIDGFQLKSQFNIMGDMKEFFKKLNINYSDSLRFEKPIVKEKVLKAWKKNKDPANKWLGECFEDELNEKKHPKIRIKYYNCDIGYAVYAAEDIGTHKFIGEYTGVVRKRSFSMIFKNQYCVEYPVGFDTLRRYVIDAQDTGNFTRFINHNSIPNVEMKSALFKDGLIHVIFIAKRLIRKDEPLTIDYGRRYWLELFKRPIPCN